MHCKVFYKHAIANKIKSLDGARDVGLLVSLSGNLFFIFDKVKEYTHIVHCKGSIDTSQCWLNQGTKTLLLSTLECSIPADDKWFKSRVTYSAPLFMQNLDCSLVSMFIKTVTVFVVKSVTS